jgi:hypothetical protein
MTHAFCTVEASTKRNTDLGNNLRGAPAAYLESLPVTPLWALRPETIETLGISSPREFKECYHVPTGDSLPDVVEGDVLVHGGTEYRIDHVAEWPDLSGGIPTLHLVVTQVKTSWPTVEAA